MKYHYTLLKMAKIQNLRKPSADKDMEQQKLSFITCGNANGTTALDDSAAVSTKSKSCVTIGPRPLPE